MGAKYHLYDSQIVPVAIPLYNRNLISGQRRGSLAVLAGVNPRKWRIAEFLTKTERSKCKNTALKYCSSTCKENTSVPVYSETCRETGKCIEEGLLEGTV